MADQNLGFGVSVEGVTKFSAVQIGSGEASPYNTTGVKSAVTGTPCYAMSATSFAGVAMVVQGSASSFSVFVWSHIKPGDFFTIVPLGAGASSMSSGLVMWSHATIAGSAEIRWSNVSTLVQNQSAVTYNIMRQQMFL